MHPWRSSFARTGAASSMGPMRSAWPITPWNLPRGKVPPPARLRAFFRPSPHHPHCRCWHCRNWLSHRHWHGGFCKIFLQRPVKLGAPFRFGGGVKAAEAVQSFRKDDADTTFLFLRMTVRFPAKIPFAAVTPPMLHGTRLSRLQAHIFCIRPVLYPFRIHARHRFRPHSLAS